MVSLADAGVPLIEATRGGRVESVHLGAIAVVDAHGALAWSAGDATLVTFPRSSFKPLQLLALARLHGAPLENYTDPDHPAQVAIRECLLDVLGLDANEMIVGIDGCSAPAYAVPLDRMARAFAWLGCPSAAPEDHRRAFDLIASAMRAHPELVAASSGRVDTELMRLDRVSIRNGVIDPGL